MVCTALCSVLDSVMYLSVLCTALCTVLGCVLYFSVHCTSERPGTSPEDISYAPAGRNTWVDI